MNCLEHHGIKGQRWGVRRYQNSDGSLTNAGRSRYGVGKPKYKIVAKSPFEKQQAKLKAQEKEMAQREEIQTRKNQLKEREARLKDLGKSEETLRKEEMKRLEKELAALKKQDEKETKKFKIQQEKEEKKELKKERKKEEEAVSYKKKQEEKEMKSIQAKRVKDMTTEELKAFNERYKAEQEYLKNVNQYKKSAAKTVADILAKSGKEAFGEVSKNLMIEVMQALVEEKSKGKYTGKSGGGKKTKREDK